MRALFFVFIFRMGGGLYFLGVQEFRSVGVQTYALFLK